MASKSKNNSLQSIVQTILKGQGKTYTRWLDEKHMEIIQENAQTIANAMETASKHGTKNELEERSHG